MNLAPWSSVLNNAVAFLTVAVAILGILALVARNQVTRSKDDAFAKYQTDSDKTISLANARAAEANEKAAEAARGTAQALSAAKQLEVDAAKQRERAAIAEKDLLALQQSQIPRVISPDLMIRLVAALRNSPEKGNVRVAWVSGDPEAAQYGSQFAEALTKGGWTPETTEMIGVNGFGLAIVVRDLATAPKLAVVLQATLRSVGIDAAGIPDTKLAASVPVTLLILTKPR